MVVDSAGLSRRYEQLRGSNSASVTPTVLGIGTEEDNTLRDTIRKAIESTYGHDVPHWRDE